MPEPIDPIYIEYATDKVLADMDMLTNWLADMCIDQTAVSSDYECRVESRLLEADIPTQLHAAFTAAVEGNAMMAGKVMQLLAGRYVASQYDRIISLASAASVGENS